MKRYPNIITLHSAIDSTTSTQTKLDDGRWVPARPLGYMSFWSRIRAALMVFRGEADALIWPGQ